MVRIRVRHSLHGHDGLQHQRVADDVARQSPFHHGWRVAVSIFVLDYETPYAHYVCCFKFMHVDKAVLVVICTDHRL